MAAILSHTPHTAALVVHAVADASGGTACGEHAHTRLTNDTHGANAGYNITSAGDYQVSVVWDATAGGTRAVQGAPLVHIRSSSCP